MGKRRNTAKTGDKALYKSRPNVSKNAAVEENSDDDAMYDAVDRFHNQQDFLKLDAGGGSSSDSEPDDGVSGKEAVLDLGMGESSSSSEEDDDEASVDDERPVKKQEKDFVSSSEDDSSEDDDEMLQQSDVRDWGRKKSSYYHGDTADLEIGQDEEDAFLEEEAAKEVEAARYEQMVEDDFVLSDDEEEKKVDRSVSVDAKSIDMRGMRDLSKLSKSDRRRLLQSHHPELMPLVSHFKHTVAEWDGRTSVAAKAVLEGDEGTIEAIGATPAGIQYLVSKALVQSSTALNVAMYLLLKSEQSIAEAETDADLVDVARGDASLAIQSHPVIARLQQLNSLAQKLDERVESKVDNLSEQLDSLVKANELMKGDEDNLDYPDHGDDSEAEESDRVDDGPVLLEGKPGAVEQDTNASKSSEEESEEDVTNSVMNDARFGLRAQEIGTRRDKALLRQRRAVPLDFGDDDEEGGRATRASRSLASTVNTIEQRSATRSRKKRPAGMAEDLGDQEEDNHSLRQGLKMMEAELGRLESDTDEVSNESKNEDVKDDSDEDDFYKIVKERSKAKKQKKASLYAVAPKYPGMDQEIQGERAISKTIMKNRGLVAHKSKLNRNPRVKKREQYRKALVRRKGQVRDVRTDEGHKYGGEQTGIKSGISRSRKLGR